MIGLYFDQSTVVFGWDGRGAEGGIGEGKGCPIAVARSRGNKRLIEQRMTAGAVVIVAVGRAGTHDSGG